jgi:glucosamine 6-phosphate synthetase-like amidotransferase/phosphosugar isomerase protein
VSNARMLRDILSQGDALADGLDRLRSEARAMRGPAYDRVVLSGSGDSYIAAVAVEALFQHHLTTPVLALTSLDASRYRCPVANDLVVAISVSGEAARTVELARRAHLAGATTVAITAAVGSSLATSVDHVLVIPEPIDRSIPHSRDYAVTLLALGCLLERLCGDVLPELEALPVLVPGLVATSLELLAELGPVEGRTWFLGAGPDRATAMYGSLKFWEAAGLESWWDDLEEFGHGSQLMARPGDRAVLIADGAGCQRATEMLPGLQAMDLEVLLVGGSALAGHEVPHVLTGDRIGPLWHPFVSTPPLQVLTYIEANNCDLDVSVPLDGQAHGPAYDRVHMEWVKQSRIVLGDHSSSHERPRTPGGSP